MADLPPLTPVAERVLASTSIVSQESDVAESLLPMLLGLIGDPDSAASRYLDTAGVAQRQVEALIPLEENRVSSFEPGKMQPLGSEATAVVSRARSLAAALGHPRAGTEHLLIALIEEHNERPDDRLKAVANLPGDPVEIRRHFFGA